MVDFPKNDNRVGIAKGQRVELVKIERAKELRHKMTEEEETLWQQLRNNQFHGLHFRRQQIIDGFIVDFYCKAALLVIEVDGEIHEQQVEYDTERDEILASRGLKILRIKNEEIRDNLECVLLKIAEVSKLQVRNE